MKNNINSSAGFSLVELMISAAIASVLASMSVGLFFEYKDRTMLTEMDLTYQNLRTSSFLVMQSMSLDVSNAACIWQYNPSGGEEDVVCNSKDGQNIINEIMTLDRSRMVVFTSFNVVGNSSDWIHTTSIFHCDIGSGVNHIDYQNTSLGTYYNIRTFEDPTAFAANCA